jgi:hypothetical protein
MVQGAAWGAFLGGLLSVGVGSVVGTGIHGLGDPDQYLNFFDLFNKFFNFSGGSADAGSADNLFGLVTGGQQIAEAGAATPGNIFGQIIPNLITTGPQQFTAFGIPLGIPLSGVAGAMIYNAGFAGAIDVSMVGDQLGVSYAQQFVMLIGAAPYFIDFAFAELQVQGPGTFASDEVSANKFFGSANPSSV